MSSPTTNERIEVTASGGRLGVFLHRDVLVTVGGPASKDVTDQSQTQVRIVALRLAARALQVAQQEIEQEQG